LLLKKQVNSHIFQGKRLFIKDIIHYLVPPNGKPASIAPSLILPKEGVGTDGNENHLNGANIPMPQSNGHVPNGGLTNGIHQKAPYPYPIEAEPSNPTVMPLSLLKSFHFTFLIRHPRYSIPSYYRCTIPPLDSVTGFYDFKPSEAGYHELRRVFDYLRSSGIIGPAIAGRGITTTEEKNGVSNGFDCPCPSTSTSPNGTTAHESGVEICVIDADDLLNNPAGTIEAYCNSIGIDYHPEMLKWDTELDHQCAKDAFLK
jgi:hypothetical protein